MYVYTYRELAIDDPFLAFPVLYIPVFAWIYVHRSISGVVKNVTLFMYAGLVPASDSDKKEDCCREFEEARNLEESPLPTNLQRSLSSSSQTDLTPMQDSIFLQPSSSSGSLTDFSTSMQDGTILD